MLLVKVFFGDLAGASTVLEHIRRRRDDAEALGARMQAFEREADRLGRASLYQSLTRRYAILWVEAFVQWANEAEEAITAAGTERAKRPDV
jgi:hypothetical protein